MDKTINDGKLKALYDKLIEKRKAELQSYYDRNKEIYKKFKEVREQLKNHPNNLANSDDVQQLFIGDGVASKGQSQSTIPEGKFSEVVEEEAFLKLASNIILEPNLTNYNALTEQWKKEDNEGQEARGFFPKNNPQLINRAIAACTDTVSVLANKYNFNKIFNWLEEEGLVPAYPKEKATDWFSKNQWLMQTLREKFELEIASGQTDNLWLNMFIWELNENYDNIGNLLMLFNSKNLKSNKTPFKSLNRILFGPPGTGKTYHTIRQAVEYLDGTIDEATYKKRFEELKAEGRVVFTTFHQSFSYEDFVEGLKATINEEGNITYQVEDGIFKTMCQSAASKTITDSNEKINLEGRTIWKMSLGNTLGDDSVIYDECIDNNYIALGYGRDIDFSDCGTKQATKEKLSQEKEVGKNDFELTAVHNLKNIMKNGDLIIVSDGNLKFRAIAEVTGDYRFLNNEERSDYQQIRQVKWHKTFSPSLSREKLCKKTFSQMTLYRLGQHTIDYEKLDKLLNDPITTENLPHLLIIDEINRGNISRIFGELITLIEEDKREGNENELSVTLPYSKEPFAVPNNLAILGTMNTADRSLTQLDLALRRRFEFVEMLPDYTTLTGITVHEVDIAELLEKINNRIECLLDRDHLIGHAYFMELIKLNNKEEKQAKLADIFKNKLIPLLQEYFYEDWENIRLVLGGSGKKIITEKSIKEEGFPKKLSLIGNDQLDNELKSSEFYDGIINPYKQS